MTTPDHMRRLRAEETRLEREWREFLENVLAGRPASFTMTFPAPPRGWE